MAKINNPEDSLEFAEKEVNKKYRANIAELLKSFPCFSDNKCYIYGNKLFVDLVNYRSKLSDDEKYDVMLDAILKTKANIENEFLMYRYILAVFRNLVVEKEKPQKLDEGEPL